MKEAFRSSGAYVLKSMTHDKVVMTLNPYHWRAQDPAIPEEIIVLPATNVPALDRVRGGEIDFANADMATLTEQDLSGKTMRAVPVGPYLAFLTVDFHGPFLSRYPDAATKINRVINREALAADLQKKLGYHYKLLSSDGSVPPADLVGAIDQMIGKDPVNLSALT